jgi:hypothetical protein
MEQCDVRKRSATRINAAPTLAWPRSSMTT